MPSFRTFLTEGALEIDNNASERAIKPFVIGRKNWLLCNTAKGARSSAVIYSIIETAKASGLAIEKYFVYLMDVLSNLEVKDKTKDMILKYMPWSKYLPQDVFLKNKDIHNSNN